MKKAAKVLEIDAQVVQVKEFLAAAIAGDLVEGFAIPQVPGWQPVLNGVAATYAAAAFSGKGGSTREAGADVEAFIAMLAKTDESLKMLLESTPEDEGDDAEAVRSLMPPLPSFACLPTIPDNPARHWLNVFMQYSRRWVPYAPEFYHEGAGLFLLSSIAARRIVIRDLGKPQYTALYVVFASETTTGKSETAENALLVMQRLSLYGPLISTGKMTPEYMKRDASGHVATNFGSMSIEEQEAELLSLAFSGKRSYFSDEFGKMLMSMMNPSGHLAELRSILLSWKNGRTNDANASLSSGKFTVRDPYIALLGNMTITDVQNLPTKSGSFWHDGFFARLQVYTPPKKKYEWINLVTGNIDVPYEVLAPLQQWHQQLGYPNVSVEPVPSETGRAREYRRSLDRPYPQHDVHVSRAVQKAFENYMNAINQLADNVDIVPKQIAGNYKRLPMEAMKVAALFASLTNGDRIDMEHWTAAQEIAEVWRGCAHEFYNQAFETEATVSRQVEDRIIAYVKKQCEEGRWSSASVVANRTRMSTEEVTRVLDALVNAHTLIKHQSVSSSGSSKPCKYALPGTPLPIGSKKK